MSNSLRPHEPQHTKPPFPSPTPGVYPNSFPLSQSYYPTISSSAVPFSSCLQSFPASGAFQMSQLFASGGQSIGVLASTSVLPMNTQDWSPLGWPGWISLQSKGLSRVFSNTTAQKHQFFMILSDGTGYHLLHDWSFLSEKRCYDLVHCLVEDWSGIRQHGKYLFVQEHTWYTAGVYSHYFHLGLSQGQHRSSTDQTLGWWKQCVKLDFWKQVPNCSGAVGEVSISQCKLPFLLTQMGKNNEHLYHLVAIYRNVQWECRLW